MTTRGSRAGAPQPPLALLESVGLDGAGNKLRISVQPVAYHEANSFWNASSLAPRLAVYYEVSVVLLDPEKPASVSGRVLSYCVQHFCRGRTSPGRQREHRRRPAAGPAPAIVAREAGRGSGRRQGGPHRVQPVR